MKILSMTATFGKLENQTLSLQPGLNIISAPNEWGKTTWCAFLVNMLYGLETRVKSTKTTLADKERYAPWSGSPMSGRIDLCWNGRNITIERWTKGRTPMGEFRAYETESGIPVPELTATTCGEMLLGVERSVFLRSGFLRLTDLPVTEDDALRRRLNALVTTGDESGAADDLAQKLRDLKNKCRSNRTTGLIPQAEAEKADLERKLNQLHRLQGESAQLAQQQQGLENWLKQLENHQLALDYAASQEKQQRIAAAQVVALSSAEQEVRLRSQCASLPDEKTAQHRMEELLSLQQQQQEAHIQVQMLPQMPTLPAHPSFPYGMNGAQAVQQAQVDLLEYEAGRAAKKPSIALWLVAAAAILLGAGMLMFRQPIPGAMFVGVGVVVALLQILQGSRHKMAQLAQQAKAESLCARYGGIAPADWLKEAQSYEQQWIRYNQELLQYQQARQQMEQRLAQLTQAIEKAAAGQNLLEAVAYWKQVLSLHEKYREVQKEAQRAAAYAENMAAMAKSVRKADMPDLLTLSPAETWQEMESVRLNLQQLQQRRGQYQGLMEAMGQESILCQQLEQVNARLARLGDTYAALELAQSTLAAATAELQRRFAPRIAQEAQQILSRLTGGRYERLSISQDLSLHAGTGEETVLRTAQHRSEGTVDQIYLALRLAVSRELTPHAPFVLDDALVRFDDVRHAAAMDILAEEAKTRQIILFTCQTREA